MESLFYAKVNLLTNCFNEAHNDNGHGIIIICNVKTNYKREAVYGCKN